MLSFIHQLTQIFMEPLLQPPAKVWGLRRRTCPLPPGAGLVGKLDRVTSKHMSTVCSGGEEWRGNRHPEPTD